MRELGGYTLLARLASGTMGDVFVASRTSGPDDADLSAVKVIKPHLANDLRFARLLLTEGATAVAFEHPVAINVLEVDREGDDIYVAQELVSGQPLAMLLKKAQVDNEPMDHRTIAWIGAEVASVLQAMHDTPWFPGAPASMVHGALSPRSVLITYEGRVRLSGVGFGRARTAEMVPISLTRMAYTPVEILQGKPVTALSDIYALGVMLYDAFTGKQVFRRSTEEEIRTAVHEARFAPMTSRTLEIDPEIGDVITEMMAPRAEARPDDLMKFEQMLRKASGPAGDHQAVLSRWLCSSFAMEREGFRRIVEAANRSRGLKEPESADSRPTEPNPQEPEPSPEPEALDSTEPEAPDPEAPELVRAEAEAPEQAQRAEREVKAQTTKHGKFSSVQEKEESFGSKPTESKSPADEVLVAPSRPSSVPEMLAQDLEVPIPPPDQAATLMDVPREQLMKMDDPVVETPKEEPKTDPAMADPQIADPTSASTQPDMLSPLAQAGVASAERAKSTGLIGELPRNHRDSDVDDALVSRTPPSDSKSTELESDMLEPEVRQDAITTAPEIKRAPEYATTSDLGMTVGRVARYRTESILVRSHTAIISTGRDPNIGRPVLLKLMDPDAVSDTRLKTTDWVRLFKREARIAGGLRHPRLPALYDAGRDESVYFIVYEWLEGEPLTAILDRGDRIPRELLHRYVADLASALDYLHVNGLVHCDLRSSNIIISNEGHAQLIDLSLASELSGSEHPLLAANLLTLSPEYLDGHGYSPLAEQFALGGLIYQLLVGTRPFRGVDDLELMTSIREDVPVAPIEIDQTVDPMLSEICMKLLQKDPAARFESCADVVRLLEPKSQDLQDTLDVDPPKLERPKPALPMEEVVTSLVGALQRMPIASNPDDPRREAPIVARSLARNLARGSSAEIFAPLIIAARDLAERQHIGAASVEILELMPDALGPLLMDVEKALNDPGATKSNELVVDIVFAVESYFNAIHPLEGARLSPRSALMALREMADKQVRSDVVEALVDHQREAISALDLAPL